MEKAGLAESETAERTTTFIISYFYRNELYIHQVTRLIKQYSIAIFLPKERRLQDFFIETPV